MADLLPPRVGQFGGSAYKGNFCEIYDHLFKNTPLFLYRFKFSEAYISLNIDLGFIKVLSFLDFADQTDHLWQIYSPQGLVSLGEVPTKVISVKSMAIYLKIPYYFYTDLNFQRPISHLILIWDSLKFYHFLDFVDQTDHLWQIYSPQGLVSLGEVPTRPTKLISVKSMTIYVKNTLIILYRFKFSEAYISLNIDLGFIKVLSFLDFVDQTDHLWQIYSPQGLVSLGEVPTKVISVKSMTIYLKIPHYFYTDLNFQRPISHCNIDLGFIKVLSFLDFADETDHLWQIYSPQGLVSLGEVPTKVISVKSMTIYLKIPHYFYTDLNFQRPISHLILIWDSLKFYHFLDFADETDHLWQIYSPQGLVSLGEVPTKVISVKCMAICLKIPSYFYTDLNFQRPISHLILIWDSLKFYHSWTLQIKLIIFGRSTPPKGWSVWGKCLQS